jgi:hypothetical protein
MAVPSPRSSSNLRPPGKSRKARLLVNSSPGGQLAHVAALEMIRAALLGFTTIQYFKCAKCTGDLAPKCSLVTTKTIDCKIVQVGEPQKAARKLDRGCVCFHMRVRIVRESLRTCRSVLRQKGLDH